MGNLLSTPSDFFLNLPDLKQIFQHAIANPSAVVSNTSSPIYFQLVVLGVIHVYTYINGCVFDWSGVDRCWSVTPMLYANSFWIYKYINTGILDMRLFTMSSLVTLWGCRLTYNFAIKGGYRIGDEDYRWKYVREKVLPQNRVIRELFHIFFVNIYQHFLIWSFTLPMYPLYESKKVLPFQWSDGVMTALWLGLFGLEMVADRQMFQYQTRKYQWYDFKKDPNNKAILKDTNQLYQKFSRKDIEEYEIGFFYKGLYAYSRHPNYFGEQGMWLTIYLWSALKLGWNWTGIGSVLLVLLFQGSQDLAEKMSSEKYPLYKEYRKRVSGLIPWFPCKDLDVALKKKLTLPAHFGS